MSNVPADLRYTKDHEWAKREADLIVVGITDHAQSQLGDVVFLELPEKGRALKSGDTFGVVESVKAVSDLYAPLAGEVVESNADVVNTPEGVNSDPYGAAWLVKIRPSSANDFDALLDAKAYEALIAK